MRKGVWLFGLLLGLLFARPTSAQDPPAAKDYTNVPPAALGVEPVPPMKDAKTGFVVGGKNDTALIRTLAAINGRPIAALEKVMRPGVQSKAGFLGKDEKLLDVLAMDNDYVRGELRRTHQDIARPLLVAIAVGKKINPKGATTFRYHGRLYRVTLTFSRFYIESPFEDETKTNCNATVENLDTGAKLQYSQLVPLMVERYGFYEGTGTPYRVDPRQVVAVFDYLKTDKK